MQLELNSAKSCTLLVMSHVLITHPAMERHGVPPGHPERPARLAAALAGVRPLGWPTLDAPEATDDQLGRVHPPAYIAAMREAFPQPGQGLVALDSGDTFLDPGSREAAYRAAGAVVAGVDSVLEGRAQTAFAIVRPPGHHAEPAQPMGFCVFNNVAVGALHALEAHGLSRVAVLDFDVHHGNGTQTVATRDARVFFASTHGSPLYPGTGFAHERGRHDTVANWPLPPGTDGALWRQVMTAEVFPARSCCLFRPDLTPTSKTHSRRWHWTTPITPGQEPKLLHLHYASARAVLSQPWRGATP